MASVIDLHIPDPPPVQNKTFPLKISGLNTSIELATGGMTGLEDIVSARDTVRKRICSLAQSQAVTGKVPPGSSALIFYSRD